MMYELGNNIPLLWQMLIDHAFEGIYGDSAVALDPDIGEEENTIFWRLFFPEFIPAYKSHHLEDKH